MEDRDIEKVADKVLTLPKQEERKADTFLEALTRRLDSIIEMGDVGYTQEILLPIPEQMVTDEEKDAKKVIALSGIVNRNEDLAVGVDMATEEIQGRNGKFKMINLVFSVDNIADAKELKAFIESKTKKGD